MAWFKTDDQLPDHRKARAVRKSHPSKRRDVSPFGIWVLAGAWSNDGFVPLEILEDWDDDAEALADRLVSAGLWHPTEREGEPGYVFHDWHDQNPAKDDNDPSSTGTFGNHVRWHVQRKVVVPDCRHCPTEPDEVSADDRPDIAPMIAPDSETHRAESLPSRPDPIPDPTRPDRTTSSDESDHALDRFDEFWDTYGHKVGRKKSEVAYRAALKKSGVTDDLLITAAAQYVAWCRETNTYLKNPLTWLHGEHWTDERVARSQPLNNVQQHLDLARRLAAEEDGQATIYQIGGGR
ncbi:MAG: hypothetical protein ACXVXW_04920 [Mycobacteriaceae bacterium]